MRERVRGDSKGEKRKGVGGMGAEKRERVKAN